jgi:hypothetical protein
VFVTGTLLAKRCERSAWCQLRDRWIPPLCSSPCVNER